eukprot:jgi/Bigna1/130920/aug1.12_g5628
MQQTNQSCCPPIVIPKQSSRSKTVMCWMDGLGSRVGTSTYVRDVSEMTIYILMIYMNTEWRSNAATRACFTCPSRRSGSLDEQIKSSKKKEGTVQEKVQERTVHISKDCRFQIFLKLSGGSEPSACFFNLFLRF